jgi:hypothetical protein
MNCWQPLVAISPPSLLYALLRTFNLIPKLKFNTRRIRPGKGGSTIRGGVFKITTPIVLQPPLPLASCQHNLQNPAREFGPANGAALQRLIVDFLLMLALLFSSKILLQIRDVFFRVCCHPRLSCTVTLICRRGRPKIGRLGQIRSRGFTIPRMHGTHTVCPHPAGCLTARGETSRQIEHGSGDLFHN